MSVPALTLHQALQGALLTLYGTPVLGLTIDAAEAGFAQGKDKTSFGLAMIHGFRIAGQTCTVLARPVLVPLPGAPLPLELPECGFYPGEVMKWTVSPSAPLTALTPTQGDAASLLAGLSRQGADGGCACKHGHDALQLAEGTVSMVRDACVSLTVENGQVCLNIPIYGSICIPIPLPLPNGTAAEACIDVCTKWSIPCGVKVTVSALGRVIATKSFGCC